MDEGETLVVAVERRHRADLSDIVDSAVVIAAQVGVGPALEYMTQHGLERSTSLRVLTAPAFHRAVHGMR